MQCNQLINQEVAQVPLKDVIERFVLITIVLLWADGSGLKALNGIAVTSFPIDRKMVPFSISHSGGVIFSVLLQSQNILAFVLHIMSLTSEASYQLVYNSLRINWNINLPFASVILIIFNRCFWMNRMATC